MQTTLDFIDNYVTDTEGVKYIGSKRTLIPYILQLIKPLKVTSVFDGFAGTTRVSQALANNNYTVILNDIAVWSKIFGECYLLNTKSVSYYQPILDHLNSLPGVEGWFTEHYGGKPNGGHSVQRDNKKRPWQSHNTMKLDAIRPEIDHLTNDPVEKSVLLTSLILAMDEVDNTVGHHAAYLRQWAPRAYKTMMMRPPTLRQPQKSHRVLHSDIFEALEGIDVDLAYYDPPYGSSNEKMPPSRVRYASYYHLWRTICLNDKPPLVGVANRRADASDIIAASEFEEFRKSDDGKYSVIHSIERLVRQTNARYIVLSYSNAGRVTRDELLDMLSQFGMKLTIQEIDYRRNVMATMTWTNDWSETPDSQHKELLFLLQKD